MVAYRIIGAILLLLVSILFVPEPGVRAGPANVALFFDKARGTTTGAELDAMAKRSALVFGPNTKQAEALRATNPTIKVILYERPSSTTVNARDYKYLDAHPNWWVLDSKGSRMYDDGGFGEGSWLLHMGQNGYRLYEENKIASEVLDQNYDGVFLDVSIPYYVKYRTWYDVNKQITSPPSGVVASWPDWMLSFHQELHAMLGGRLHIFNSWPATSGRYREFQFWLDGTLAVADGVQFDGFCYNRDQAWSLAKWQYQVSQAARIIGLGKVTMLKTPLDNLRSQPAKLAQLQRFCFGTYQLVADGKYAFFRNVDESDVTYWNATLFTIPLGSPQGAYYPVGSGYARTFTNGTVIVNPTLLSFKTTLAGREVSVGPLDAVFYVK